MYLIYKKYKKYINIRKKFTLSISDKDFIDFLTI